VGSSRSKVCKDLKVEKKPEEWRIPNLGKFAKLREKTLPVYSTIVFLAQMGVLNGGFKKNKPPTIISREN
jgi:hypothetical protein